MRLDEEVLLDFFREYISVNVSSISLLLFIISIVYGCYIFVSC